MKTVLSIFIIIFFLYSCSIDRTISNLNSHDKEELIEFQKLNKENKVKICDESEPGERLYLCLKFISFFNKGPLKNYNIKFFHTSSNGNYEPSNPNDESTARLNGKVLTNFEGKVFVETILPGDYGSSSDNRHIHCIVDNAKPETYDIHFKQYTGFMGKNFIKSSNQHFLAELKQIEDSSLVVFLTIVVKNINNN